MTPQDEGDLPRCYNCFGPAAVEEGLCRDCFNEINGPRMTAALAGIETGTAETVKQGSVPKG